MPITIVATIQQVVKKVKKKTGKKPDIKGGFNVVREPVVVRFG